MALGASAAVIDVGDADFDREVLERSKQVPVVVDFWAPWCGPCRTLGPVLERLAAQHAGAFVLAKVNVDEAPAVAQRYGVRSIPLVVGFRDGAAASEFVGAQPEPAVRQFLEALIPNQADKLVAEGAELFAGGHANAAEERFRAALALAPRHPRGLVALARVHAERGEKDAALALLGRLGSASRAIEQEAERLAAELRTAGDAGADIGALRARAEAAPEDLAARLELGRALVAARRYAEALPELLAVVERDKSFADEAARKTMLDVFEVLGSDHDLTQEFRSALARALFR